MTWCRLMADMQPACVWTALCWQSWPARPPPYHSETLVSQCPRCGPDHMTSVQCQIRTCIHLFLNISTTLRHPLVNIQLYMCAFFSFWFPSCPERVSSYNIKYSLQELSWLLFRMKQHIKTFLATQKLRFVIRSRTTLSLTSSKRSTFKVQQIVQWLCIHFYNLKGVIRIQNFTLQYI